MRAAILREYGRPPEAGEFAEPPPPGPGQVAIDVEVGGLNPVDLSMASGSFYGGSPPLPSVAGREGIGRTAGGARVYFASPVAPHGSFAERTLALEEDIVPVPEGLDAGVAVALGIAGLAAWLALEWRAELRPGESVLVLGASGVVGRIAVQAARVLGAGRVVAAARHVTGLEALGADAVVPLDATGDLTAAFRDATGGGPDVVVDPLWGPPAVAAIEACRPRARVVQIGQSAGAEATLASSPVRGRLLSILGHTNFLVPAEVRRATYERMTGHAAAGELGAEVERIPLEGIGEAWERQARAPHRKLVIVP